LGLSASEFVTNLLSAWHALQFTEITLTLWHEGQTADGSLKRGWIDDIKQGTKEDLHFTTEDGRG